MASVPSGTDWIEPRGRSAADAALASVSANPEPAMNAANANALDAVPSPLPPAQPKPAPPSPAVGAVTATSAPTPLVPPASPIAADFSSRLVSVERYGQNPLSSANGTGQFLDRTWLNITLGEPEVAGKNPQQILQMRVSKPQFAKRMVDKLATQNAQYLQSVGLPVNDGTLYLAHFFGPDGAAAVLKSPRDLPLVQVKDAKGRPIGAIALSANPQLAGMTAGSVADYAASTINGRRAGQDDPAHQKYLEVQQAGITRLNDAIDRYTALAEKEPPGSAERHRLLQAAIDHSQQLSERYERLSQAPPKPQSPFEAAGMMTPLLIGLVTLAGGLTRRPALGAINALGSALGALKQGNDENYQRAVDLWSKQSELAQKAFSMQNQTIDAIMRDLDLSERERQEKLQNAYRVLGLSKDLELAKASQWKEAYEYQDKRKELASKLEKESAETQAALALAAQRKTIAEAGGTSPVAIEHSKLRREWQADPNNEGKELTPAIDRELYEKALTKVGRGGSSDPKRLTVEAFREKIKAETGHEPVYEDWVRFSQDTKQSSTGQLSADAVKLLAKQYEMGDVQVITSLPRSGPGRIQVENQIAEDLREVPDAARAIVMNRLRMAEAQSAAKTAGRITMQTDMYATEAIGAGQQVIETSKLFPRTEYPTVNAALAAFERGTGDPNVIKFGLALNSLFNVYGKMSNPTGTGIHDADKERVTKLLDTALAQGQIEAGVQQVIKEGEVVAAAALDAQQKVLTSLAPGPVGSPPSAPTETLPPGIPAGSKKVGTYQGKPVYQAPDGSKWQP